VDFLTPVLVFYYNNRAKVAINIDYRCHNESSAADIFIYLHLLMKCVSSKDKLHAGIIIIIRDSPSVLQRLKS
jgi:hypothetical protein